jgi:hypothetical protein
MSKKGANSKQEKLMARASAPKEQERVAEAAKRSVETCSAGRAGAHPPAPAERLGLIISTVHTNGSTLSTVLQLAVEDPDLLAAKVRQYKTIEPLIISSAIIAQQVQSLFLTNEEAVDTVGSVVNPRRIASR